MTNDRHGKKALREVDTESIHTTTIRVSERLIERLRQKASETGASINSTICQMLDLGLSVTENTITIHR